ncbi:MAG: MTAP family purine nucleoside phosphorylase [Caldilineaceae bacterium]|nr:MTAP family purine nucleoside phosphorylase [Caldilineaceae bacterium]
MARRVSHEGVGLWLQPYTGLPTRTDPRATLFAARELEVRRVLNWDMGIAVNPVLRRGQPLIAADYIDWSRHQPSTYFGDTAGASGAMRSRAPAFCPQMTAALGRALPFAAQAIYLAVDGPRRETPAEARMFRAWGADMIGQNIVPEVSLARELGLCYAGLVSIADVSADLAPGESQGDLRSGLETTMQALPAALSFLGGAPTCSCADDLPAR